MISNFRKGYDMLAEICPIYGYSWLFHKKTKKIRYVPHCLYTLSFELKMSY